MTQVNPMTKALREGDIDTFFKESEQLYERLHSLQNPIICDRSYRFKKYKSCFKGSEFIGWLVDQGVCQSRAEALGLGLSLVMFGVVHHVVDDHNFKDEDLFFRFRIDDKTYRGEDASYRNLIRVSNHVHATMHAAGTMINDRDYGLRKYKKCFVAKDFLKWLQTQELAKDDADALALGLEMQRNDIIHHVCDDHEIKDGFLYFRFRIDELKQPNEYFTFFSHVAGGMYLGHVDKRLKVLLPKNRDKLHRMMQAQKVAQSGGDDVDGEIPAVPRRRSVDKRSQKKLDPGMIFMNDICPTSMSALDNLDDMENVTQQNSDQVVVSDDGIQLAQGSSSIEEVAELDETEVDRHVLSWRLSENQYLKDRSWYHGLITREDAQQRLVRGALEERSWLMWTNKKDTTVMISLLYDGQIYHMRILRWVWLKSVNSSMPPPILTYSINNKKHFDSLQKLVTFQKSDSQGLPCVLGPHIAKV